MVIVRLPPPGSVFDIRAVFVVYCPPSFFVCFAINCSGAGFAVLVHAVVLLWSRRALAISRRRNVTGETKRDSRGPRGRRTKDRPFLRSEDIRFLHVGDGSLAGRTTPLGAKNRKKGPVFTFFRVLVSRTLTVEVLILTKISTR